MNADLNSAAALNAKDVAKYPPQARALAEQSLDVLRPLPLLFAASLLRQMASYDWQFPAERAGLETQLELLKQRGPGTLAETAQEFAKVTVSPELAQMPWAAEPARFSEALTAYLWSSRQINVFEETAKNYSATLAQLRPVQPPAHRRLCLVLLGQGASADGLPLFEKLRPHGTLFRSVDTSKAWESAREELRKRAAGMPAPYQHWMLDGGAATASEGVATLSYTGLSPMRQKLLDLMQSVRTSGPNGPEALRSAMQQMQPQQLGESAFGDDPVLQHFALSLFSEGSGTQIYSTTFVQWAAREVLRRAQPSTMLVHYSPRQISRPMDVLLSAKSTEDQLDPQGSLVDADMGAYYTWLNLRRLAGSDQDTFLACHEGGNQVLAISPSSAGGAVSMQPCHFVDILRWNN